MPSVFSDWIEPSTRVNQAGVSGRKSEVEKLGKHPAKIGPSFVTVLGGTRAGFGNEPRPQLFLLQSSERPDNGAHFAKYGDMSGEQAPPLLTLRLDASRAAPDAP